MKRKHISLKEKLAAALFRMATQYLHETATITRDYTAFDKICDCKKQLMSAEEFISLFHFDHTKFHCYGDEDRDRWWNLVPMLAEDHREKTRRDIGIIAKGKRIQRKQARHKAAMAAKGNHDPAS